MPEQLRREVTALRSFHSAEYSPSRSGIPRLLRLAGTELRAGRAVLPLPPRAFLGARKNESAASSRLAPSDWKAWFKLRARNSRDWIPSFSDARSRPQIQCHRLYSESRLRAEVV